MTPKKYYTVDEFVKFFADHEDTLWDMIADYKEWKRDGEIGNCLLRTNSQTFCSNVGIPLYYHTEYMEHIALGIYKYFAMKYKELKTNEEAE